MLLPTPPQPIPNLQPQPEEPLTWPLAQRSLLRGRPPVGASGAGHILHLPCSVGWLGPLCFPGRVVEADSLAFFASFP